MKNKKNAVFPRSTALLLALVLLLAAGFGALAEFYASHGGSLDLMLLIKPMEITEIPPLPELATEPTAPAPATVVSADGNAKSVLCRAYYTVSPELAAQEAEKIAATAGKEKLTNAQLQIYYLSAVEAGRNAEVKPESGIPLEEQLCPLGKGNLSWQHYYLQQAIALWRTQVGLVAGTQEKQVITEEAFQPHADLHETYIAPELPVNGFLYQDLPCYTPNSMHQAYLDGMEERLDTLAKEKGFAGLRDMVTAVYGAGTTAEDVIAAAKDFNLAYMYYTEKTYAVPANEAELPTGGERHVNLRHVLLIPEDAKVAQDGTVTATEEQWDECRKEAESMLTSWRYEYLTNRDLPSNFARLANKSSADAGSQINGGFYGDLHQGEFIAPVDAWCFDADRQEGDIEIIQSDVGIHIVYLHSFVDTAATDAQESYLRQKHQDIISQYTDSVTVKPDYSAVALWVDPERPSVGLTDALYPDVAHQRFPEVMTYLQQDYMYHPYGGSYVGRGGCGITTMAMLATYMTDEIHTPGMMATQYGQYHDASGTNGDIFRYVPAEMGFYLEKTSPKIEEVIEALQNGQIVISLQVLGHFTRGGHYLLVQQYYEEDDTFQIRDSNVYNYGRLEGHQADRFTRWQLLSGGSTFWIMEKKITAIPACDRCGLGFAERGPEKLLTGDYLCEKCAVSAARRNHFLSAIL